MDLYNIRATGLGGFEVHTAQINLWQLSFQVDITIPNLEITAGKICHFSNVSIKVNTKQSVGLYSYPFHVFCRVGDANS